MPEIDSNASKQSIFEKLLSSPDYTLETYRIYNIPGHLAFVVGPENLGFCEVYLIDQYTWFITDGRFPVCKVGHWLPEKKKMLSEQYDDISATPEGKEISRIFERAGHKFGFRCRGTPYDRKERRKYTVQRFRIAHPIYLTSLFQEQKFI